MVKFIQRLFFILFAFICTPLYAQQGSIEVVSFTPLPTDMTAQISAPRIDENSGEKASLIKIITPETGFIFENGMMGVVDTKQDVGEIWVYLPPNSRKITIKHQRFGILRDYFFPSNTESGRVYEMTIKVEAAPDQSTSTLTEQYVVFKYTPENVPAFITVDNGVQMQGENGMAQLMLPPGEHTYTVSAPQYQNTAGKLVVTNEKAIVEFELISARGYINFSSVPEQGATIYIDDEYAGITPFTSEPLKEGEHTINVSSKYYLPLRDKIVAPAGDQTLNHVITLQPNYSNVNIAADENSEIYINDQAEGTGSISRRLTPGIYKIEARRESHTTVAKVLTVEALQDQRVELAAPEPIYGFLNISSTPFEAEVYIDGELRCTTPDLINNVLIGEREITLKKDGYASQTQRVTITEENTSTLEVELHEGVEPEEENETTNTTTTVTLEEKPSSSSWRENIGWHNRWWKDYVQTYAMFEMNSVGGYGASIGGISRNRFGAYMGMKYGAAEKIAANMGDKGTALSNPDLAHHIETTIGVTYRALSWMWLRAGVGYGSLIDNATQNLDPSDTNNELVFDTQTNYGTRTDIASSVKRINYIPFEAGLIFKLGPPEGGLLLSPTVSSGAGGITYGAGIGWSIGYDFDYEYDERNYESIYAMGEALSYGAGGVVIGGQGESYGGYCKILLGGASTIMAENADDVYITENEGADFTNMNLGFGMTYRLTDYMDLRGGVSYGNLYINSDDTDTIDYYPIELGLMFRVGTPMGGLLLSPMVLTHDFNNVYYGLSFGWSFGDDDRIW